MNNLAPIVLFVYNRLWHTQQTIEALQKNELASESNLIIYSDGVKKESDIEDVNKIREFIKSITGFKSISIIYRDRNYGLAENIIKGVSEIVSKYGRIIVLEDDLVSSPYFLKYMNDALNLYENALDVISIHGYIYPIKKKLPETFFIKGADCWGWATWKRGWDLFQNDGEQLLNELLEKKLSYDFDFYNSYPFTQMLKDQVSNKNNSWAIKWYASAFLKNKLTLYPGMSLIKNIGNDNSGTHSNNTKEFDSALNRQPIILKKQSLIEIQSIKKEIAKSLNPDKQRNLLRRVFKEICPPLLLKLAKKIGTHKKLSNNEKQDGWFFGYTNWTDAKLDCSGYDSRIIVEKVRTSMLKVTTGEYPYERDSVNFDKIQYSYPLLSGLMWIAAQNNGVLNIIDFGGALGSTYYQNKIFLSSLNKVQWNIVEQTSFVDIGKQEFENNSLHFYYTIQECLDIHKSKTILFSSVIQYIENPYTLLSEVLNLNFEYIIFDRTAFVQENNDLLSIQKVPDSIYSAIYPAWFFSKSKFLNLFLIKYVLIVDFEDSFIQPSNIDGHVCSWSGFILKRRLNAEND